MTQMIRSTHSATKVSHVLSVLIISVCLLSSGCAVAGAGVGAAIGAHADRHHPARGAFFGATVGALTGSFLDGLRFSSHHHDRRHHSCDD